MDQIGPRCDECRARPETERNQYHAFVAAPAPETMECPVCKGSCLVDDRDLCANCGATGRVAAPRPEALPAGRDARLNLALKALREILDFQPDTSALDAKLDEAWKASQECAECQRLRAIPHGLLTACGTHYDARARLEMQIEHQELHQSKWRPKEIARAALAAVERAS